MNILLFDDTRRCVDYFTIMFYDFVTVFKYIVPDTFLGFAQLGLFMHKIPLVMKTCKGALEDVKAIDAAAELYSSTLMSIDVGAHLLENLLFNGGDILNNILDAR